MITTMGACLQLGEDGGEVLDPGVYPHVRQQLIPQHRPIELIPPISKPALQSTPLR